MVEEEQYINIDRQALRRSREMLGREVKRLDGLITDNHERSIQGTASSGSRVGLELPRADLKGMVRLMDILLIRVDLEVALKGILAEAYLYSDHFTNASQAQQDILLNDVRRRERRRYRGENT